MPKNLHKFFLLIYLLKELIMLWRFYINVTGCGGITGYWSEAIFIISFKENIVFGKLFETSFGSDIITSFTEFQCKVLIPLGLSANFWNWKHKAIFYINNAWILL